ncbi:MAG TPA: peptidoglycan -binding protein [Stellaceae bacterium]|jgi:chemotaxis protein MotB|nr:peptidoglycan -binding protein [Stellaceae bacterium]
MPLSRRRTASSINIWPGFVDALTQLVMVIVFVLLVFTVGQFYLSGVVNDRDLEIKKLSAQISHLADELSMTQSTDKTLQSNLDSLNAQLRQTLQERDELARERDALQSSLTQSQKDEAEKNVKLTDAAAQIAMLNQNINALRQQLTAIANALDLANVKVKDQQVQIADLGTKLNLALAKRVEDLANYRSEFFVKLKQILGNRPDIRIVGDRFVFQSEVLFATGSDALTPEAQKRLEPIVSALNQIKDKIPSNIHWILEIDGHTDSTPIKSTQFKSNWELSTARALSVVRFLIAHGVPADHLSAAGFGEFQPIDTADTPEAKQKNRRIEIRLTQR